MTRYLFIFFFLLIFSSTYSQSMLPVSLDKRLALSSCIVEGKVVNQRSYWNAGHTWILTSNEIEVYKVFKGAVASRIYVITEGGQVDKEMLLVDPELELHNGDVGIFLLTASSRLDPVGGSFIPVAASQGFIQFDLIDGTGSDVFYRYQGIPYSVEQIISQVTGMNMPVKAMEIKPVLDHTLAPPVIAAFLPLSIPAGTFSNLTITGTNFGASYSGSANVEFKNANDGGLSYVSAPANHIVSWSDIQIVVKVPTGAGTGVIRITNSGGESNTSVSSLTIPYNQTLVNSGIYYEPNLINKVGGGYRMSYSTATSNSGVDFSSHTLAKARYESALSNWKCNTGYNCLVTGTSSVQNAASDGVSLVGFDNAVTPLPSGVLGRASSFYTGCGAPLQWFVNDIDIIFKRDGTDGVTWYFGTSAAGQPGGTSDFESVALHETGHNHQLGHVNSPGAVMHYAIVNGTNNRNLSAADINGGSYVLGHSTSFNAPCSGFGGMVTTSCSIPPVADFTASPTSWCSTPVTVNFFDASTGQPTSWNWSFPGGSPSSSAAKNPSVVYNTAGTYNVSLTATNAFGSDGETKNGFITIGAGSLPSNLNFEGAFPPTGVTIVNADGQETWRQITSITGRSGASTKAAYVEHYNYNLNVGTADDLITPFVAIPGSGVTLAFDLAYARYDAANYERLQIFVSTDCGATFNAVPIYDKSGSSASGNTLSTSDETTNYFVPSSVSQWRRETLNLNAYAGQTVQFKFRTINGYGNNLYIDNIDVTGPAACFGPNIWTGAVSTAWENPGNWSCLTVPTASTDVQINSGTVIVSSAAVCRSLITSAGVNVTVNTGWSLTVVH